LGAPLFAARVIATGAPHGFGTRALALQLSERTLGGRKWLPYKSARDG